MIKFWDKTKEFNAHSNIVIYYMHSQKELTIKNVATKFKFIKKHKSTSQLSVYLLMDYCALELSRPFDELTPWWICAANLFVFFLNTKQHPHFFIA